MNPIKTICTRRAEIKTGDVRELSMEIHVYKRRPLRISAACKSLLRRRLKRIMACNGCGDEVLRRLKADMGIIENCLRQACSQAEPRLPAGKGGVRILQLARTLIADGEVHLDREGILAGVKAFDSIQMLDMQELECLPDALCIALCEGFCGICAETLKRMRMRRHAERWIEKGGRTPVSVRETDVFFEHALQLAAEMESPELCAKIERILDRRGQKASRVVEFAHRDCADRCLRLENMLAMWHLTGALNWEKCFGELSTAEAELREDPAGIYGVMDASSRGEVRRAVAEISQDLQVDELSVVRYALRMAREAVQAHGLHDPRAGVCWYLLEDEGRRALCGALGCKCRLRRRVPDGNGTKTALLMTGVVSFALVIIYAAMDRKLLAVYALPLAWVAAMRLISRFYPRWVKPNRIVKLALDAVPDGARTLVVFPVLLSSAERTGNMVEHMEALGCLERDENIDFLLLGDFRDANAEHMPEDAEILSAARRGMERLNASAGRKKYFYLHRGRSFRERDGIWMGENRKRGALTALNRLLLMREGAGRCFSAEGDSAVELAGRYRYVVTLDADTEFLPGDLHRLIGAMHHPLNRSCMVNGRRRGYAVLQPNMQLMAEACSNAYTRLTFGKGGMDSYPVSVSDFYQDMTGWGNFAGKGIYDVRAFAEATEDILQDDAILSHDLIEGILAGAGYLNDVHFYDGCPDSLEGELSRLHRWTRGDWQLLPVILSGLHIRFVDRMKMIGNLLRSLYAPTLLGLLVHAVWLDAPLAFALGLVLSFQEPILQLPRLRKPAWKAALLRLAVLPAEAACMLDAILRTLWRLVVSQKHLMEWVPAADAGRDGRRSHVPGSIVALLLLPGMLRPFWIPAVLALAALFFVGARWARDLAGEPADQSSALNGEQVALILDLAKRTWSFFEKYVPEDGCGLPPDNVQLDPPVGEARRTSPTNIGLYLMSCISAQELGFLDEDTMLRRIANSVRTLEALEKWNGQLYNWYDINDLSPLRPRYVSSVDSGNLAGALMLCAAVVRNVDESLSLRLRVLAEDMNLAALYDPERKLFCIGMDVQGGRMSESHYDLYASEARILSYTAMMLGQVPTEHWKHLSRAGVRLGREQALVSWSGTMFEYLMPELLLMSLPNTLAGQSRRGAVACQMAWGRRLERPWGVSESGYYAFDLHLNYQYRAFGLRDLAMSGNAVQDVVAPYAAALALVENPAAAADNLRRMCEMGWSGEWGLYEAADYLHMEGVQRPHIVRSYMAHHQGMTLCALCNALRGNVLSKRFMEIPQARALRLLLQEKEAGKLPRRDRTECMLSSGMREHNDAGFTRMAKRQEFAVEAHLLCGGGSTVLVNDRGGAYAWRKNIQLNRFSGDLLSRHEGMYIHLEDLKTGEKTVLGNGGRMLFEPGCVLCRQDFGSVRVQMRTLVSPEDGCIYQSLDAENTGDDEVELAVCGCMSVALAPENDMRAHPVFQNLFIESECLGEGILVFRRRRRDGKEALPEMVYLISGTGDVEFETDYERLTGRTGSIGSPGGIRELTGSQGCVLNPCGALRTRLHLKGSERISLHFALALVLPEERDARIEQMRRADMPERALQLSSTQMQAVLGHAGIDGRHYRLFQRVSMLLFDAKLRKTVLEGDGACEAVPRSLMWKAGISGDLPILLVEFDEKSMDCVREGMRLHAFWRLMGVHVDLVLINIHGSDYLQAARGTVGDLLASSHLNGQIHAPGGAHVLEIQNLEEETYRAICRAAVIRLRGREDAVAQLRSALDGTLLRETEGWAAMQSAAMQLPADLKYFNGYGGFDGKAYRMLVKKDLLPPAPWSNVLASEHAGAVVTERGGGFAWHMNSRSGRLTPFANDVLHEGWGWMFYLVDEGEDTWIRLLPGDIPMTDFIVSHQPGRSSWQGRAGELAFEVQMHAQKRGVQFELHIRNEGKPTKHLRLAGFVDWLMGTDSTDTGLLRSWSHHGACFASGAMEGVGCFACDDPRARTGCDRMTLFSGGDMMKPHGLDMLDLSQGGWTLHLPVNLKQGEQHRCRFLLGCGKDTEAAYGLARDFRSGESLRRSSDDWEERLNRLRIHTPDTAVNLLANGFLQAQTLNGRIRARTGLYQPGGAFGFRDQLQDMLAMVHYEPQLVRRHLLYCASRQFEAGDVLHWWHEPYSGVRTQIRDDLLFLPYVTANYVRITGDESVLWEGAPFLEDTGIPEGREDIYASMKPSAHVATLHEHCMRAFRRAAQTGSHGLCLMGAGDWNDGMNRVGIEGRGESVWLSEFLAACAAEYAQIAPNAEDRAWLMGLNEQMIAALEENAWDGAWYLRAYTDEGMQLGGHECECCRIDLISQAWAVLSGLDKQRCSSAVDAAWEQLADEKLKLIRLLTPPFDADVYDPGYIAAYPNGIRENGAQYTHAACWMLIALAEMGDVERAHRALQMLLPVNHASTRADADVYRVEPYVMAADVYTNPKHEGRGGWTWYTGSAAWMLLAILKLLGYEREGNRVRLNALLGDWEEVQLELKWGLSRYCLICRRDAQCVSLDGETLEGDWICLADDGREHTAIFPARKEGVQNQNKNDIFKCIYT